jgi:uncharacterized protein (TIGR02271 family)
MSKTVTSLFHDHHTANATVSRLEQAGISRGNVTVYSGASTDLSSVLPDLGVPASDAHAYAEGVRRGGSLVTVRCDEGEVDQVIDILDGDEGILDLDEQQTSWRSEGWQSHEHSTPGSTGMTGGLAAAATGLGAALTGGSSRTTDMEETRTGLTGRSSTGTSDEVIQVAEEELHVGKREVQGGRVRIHSHVVERPVQEQVTLRDETVNVERRPVSGERATTMTGDPFQERTIEVEEHDEEAVVSKQARVKEELVVRKDVEQRTETISDTVRKTEVEVEDDRIVRGTGTGTTDRKL